MARPSTPARSFSLPSTTAATQRIAFYLSEWAQVGSFIDVDKVTVQALADPNLATVPGILFRQKTTMR